MTPNTAVKKWNFFLLSKTSTCCIATDISTYTGNGLMIVYGGRLIREKISHHTPSLPCHCNFLSLGIYNNFVVYLLLRTFTDCQDRGHVTRFGNILGLGDIMNSQRYRGSSREIVDTNAMPIKFFEDVRCWCREVAPLICERTEGTKGS